MSDLRACSNCGRLLPERDFYNYTSLRDGKKRSRSYSKCRGCKVWLRNLACNNDPKQFIRRACQQLKSGRKKRQPYLSFEVTPEMLIEKYETQGARCALSGLPMENFRDGSGVKNPHNISIDRIDNDVGYVESNVQLVCQAINIMKGTLEDEEFIRLCKHVSRNSTDR